MRIRHVAITAEDPFETAALFKQAFGLKELSREYRNYIWDMLRSEFQAK